MKRVLATDEDAGFNRVDYPGKYQELPCTLRVLEMTSKYKTVTLLDKYEGMLFTFIFRTEKSGWNDLEYVLGQFESLNHRLPINGFEASAAHFVTLERTFGTVADNIFAWREVYEKLMAADKKIDQLSGDISRLEEEKRNWLREKANR